MKTILLLCTLLAGGFPMAHSQDKTRSQRIHQVFNDLRATNLEILDSFYHPQVQFLDPLGSVDGLDGMKKYYGKLYSSVEEIRFDFTDEVIQEDTHVVFWTMILQAPRLNGGKAYPTIGLSHIRFDPETDLVIYHRDYFDMGEFIYERLPVMKSIIPLIKKQLK